ncbi:AraC family transcriptional regulator [Bacillus marinisedimentorum]|uniref:AraC family transcriptional regulator n=1 Tax=Bacillus marinisedimentorum TaxID=1821260 RepID=UPI0008722700|nr:AraC family transcriptional regulator [Bacillus marinisedimentorum]
MEELQRMMDSINFIEDRLDQEVSIEEVAASACSSKFHFQRMFQFITGVTVAEYIRRRRLTVAAQELSSTSIKVIDVALKYGYETPESFSKAFRKMHGMSPSQARESGRRLKAYPRLSFQIQIKGDQDMNYRIVEKEAFEVIGKGKRVRTANGENMKTIPAFWDEMNKNGTSVKLCKPDSEDVMYGICMEFDRDLEEFTYFIAGNKPDGTVPAEFEVKQIPASTWAVFDVRGAMPDAMQKVWGRIFSEWFPATGYAHAEAPELELYLPGNPADEDYRSEIWIPIIKK